MILLFVGLALTALMAYIIRQLHFYLSPERFRQIVVPLIPTYLLINWVLIFVILCLRLHLIAESRQTVSIMS